MTILALFGCFSLAFRGDEFSFVYTLMTMSYGFEVDRQIVIFASELASAIDQHPYKPREETALGVWKRFDQASFTFWLALSYMEEVFELTKAYLAKDKPMALRSPLPGEIESDEGKRAFMTVLKAIFTKPEWRGFRRRVREFVDTKEFRDSKEKVLLNELGENRKVNEAMATLCSEENKTVQEKVQEVCKKITKETGKDVDKQTQDALTSKLSKDRGTILEEKTVKDYVTVSGKHVRREPTKLYRKLMNHGDVSWIVCGRVDARDENTIVEVKNRTKRFMCPDYDLLQLQTYMFLCDKTNGILLERLHGKNKETPFEFNKSFWNEAVVPALYDFVMDVQEKVFMSRSVLDDVTPAPSPRKRGHDLQATSSEVKKAREGLVDKGSSWVNEGSSWDNEGSSDNGLNSCSGSPINESFVLYLSPSETESDDELANLPLENILSCSPTY